MSNDASTSIVNTTTETTETADETVYYIHLVPKNATEHTTVYLQVSIDTTISTVKKWLCDSLSKVYADWVVSIYDINNALPDTLAISDANIKNNHCFEYTINPSVANDTATSTTNDTATSTTNDTATSTEQTNTNDTATTESQSDYLFPDVVVLKSKDEHSFALSGRLLRHCGMYRGLYKREIAQLTQSSNVVTNNVSVGHLDVNYDHVVVGTIVDYLHYRDRWIPNEKGEKVPEYSLDEEIDKRLPQDQDKNTTMTQLLIAVNEIDC